MADTKGPARKPIDRATLGRIVSLFRPYRNAMVAVGMLVVAAAGLGLLPPLFLRALTDDGLLKGDLAVVTRCTPLNLAATVAGAALSLAYGYLSMAVGQRLMRDLRNRLNDHLQGMSLRFFTQTRTGEIQSRLVSDVGGMQGVLSDTLTNILANVTTMLSTLAVMFYMD